jgi:NTE family protein
MLFHLGSLWRLNELGILPHLNLISSVSGGSITNGVLGLAWNDLSFDSHGVAQRFHDEIVEPIRNLASKRLDGWAIAGSLLTVDPAGEWIARAYDKHVFHEKTLRDLPVEKKDVAPRFVFNASNVQTGSLFRFSREFIRDWRVGEIKHPRLKLSYAVAASSAFPPVLSPLTLSFSESDYTPLRRKPTDSEKPPFTTSPVLTDGGVYDNLGLETAWKRYRTILVSDAGGHISDSKRQRHNWLLHTMRVLNVIDIQVRSLRKRQVIGAYQLPRDSSTVWRSGTYWGIRTDIDNYELSDSLPCPHAKTILIAEESTRLTKISSARQEKIINWGYAVCDTAMRRWVLKGKSPEPQFPFKGGVG